MTLSFPKSSHEVLCCLDLAHQNPIRWGKTPWRFDNLDQDTQTINNSTCPTRKSDKGHKLNMLTWKENQLMDISSYKSVALFDALYLQTTIPWRGNKITWKPQGDTKIPLTWKRHQDGHSKNTHISQEVRYKILWRTW
jgi:hypothetical protein